MWSSWSAGCVHIHHMGAHVAGSRLSSKVIPGFRGSTFEQADVRVQWLLHLQGGERCAGQSEPGGRDGNSIPTGWRYPVFYNVLLHKYWFSDFNFHVMLHFFFIGTENLAGVSSENSKIIVNKIKEQATIWCCINRIYCIIIIIFFIYRSTYLIIN